MIVLSGESHLGAIRRGAPDNPNVVYWPLGVGKLAPTQFFQHDKQADSVRTTVRQWRNRVYSKETLTFDGKQALLAISLPLNTSRILRDYAWNTHVPWKLQNEPHEAPLSDAAVAAILQQDYQQSLDFIQALLTCGLNVVVIEGPRFFEDAAYLKRNRLDVCAYIDGLYRSTVKDALRKLGVDIIEQRPETITPLGLTSMEFNHEDPADKHHANTAFGAMMYEDLMAYAKGRTTSGPS